LCEDRIAQPSTPLHQRAVKESGPPAEGLGTRDAEGRRRGVGRARRPAVVTPRASKTASTAPWPTCLSGAEVTDIPLPKRPPGDAPGRTRTCDPLLRRREHLLRSTAASRSDRPASDGPHITAALCCGLPLPQRFHWSRSRWAELPRSRSHTKGAALPTRGSALSIGFAALLPSRAAARGRASLQSRVVNESMATVIARMSGASSPAATSTP
jgi:hypothetical protein